MTQGNGSKARGSMRGVASPTANVKSLLLFLFLLVLGGGNGGGIGNIVPVDASSTGTPIPTLHVSLKGKTYELHDVTTLPELQERLEEVSGVSPKQQGRVLWNGQRLTTTPTAPSSTSSDGSETPLALSEVGVKDGDQLNCVPATPGKKKTTNKTSNTESGSGTNQAVSKDPASTSSKAKENDAVDGTSSSSSNPSIKDLLKGAGMDTSGLDEMMKMMGNGSGGNGGGDGGSAPSLQESMAMMTDMMKSPLFTQLMNDPEKLEESRQMILNNPMLKQMLAGLPGMEDLLNDPVAWRQAMQAVASLYQNMDPNDLMTAMMEGANASMGGSTAGGMGMGLPPGLFNGMDTTTTTMSALDELSEGE